MANSDYKTYTFSTNSSPKRHYKGTRINPMEGIELGITLVKLMANAANSSSTDGDFSLGIKFIAGLDTSKVLSIFKDLLNKIQLEAKVDGTNKNMHLAPSLHKNMDEWFREYPHDLMLVIANVLAENAAPFLPEKFQGNDDTKLNITKIIQDLLS